MKEKAFTLIELLVVIAVIGLIASIVLVNLRGTREKATVARGLRFSQSIHHALGAYAVAIYRFERATAFPPVPVTPDTSGYGNDLVCAGCLGGVTPCEGIINNSFVFNEHVFGTVPGSARNFNFSQTNEITIEAWFLLTETPPLIPPYFLGSEIINIADVDFPIHYTYRISVDQDLHLIYHPGSSNVNQIITDFTFELDKWYHIAMTIRGGGEAEIYINGKSVRKSFDGVPLILPDGVYLGIGNAFKGIIDEVRIYNQAFNL